MFTKWFATIVKRTLRQILGFIISFILRLYSRSTFEIWLTFVQKLRIRLHLNSQNYRRLITLPQYLKGWTWLEFNGEKIRYLVTKNDDLNIPLRFNLEGWEDESREAFRMLCQDVSMVLDIGAYTGIYSLIALSTNSEAKVVSFEPNPFQASVLRENIEANNFANRTTILEFALSDIDGYGKLSVKESRESNGSSMASLSAGSRTLAEVEIHKLDSLFTNLKFDLLKIDVEGGELAVLKGGQALLTQNRPIIIAESLQPNELLDLIKFLHGIGYNLPKVLDYRNFLFVPKDEFTDLEEN